jgi:hypothetical protein
VLTPDEARDLAVLKRARHRIRSSWMWWGGGGAGLLSIFWGGSCAMQAVMWTTHRGADRQPVYLRLRAQLPPGWSQIADYNDAPTTTHADVLKLFDAAIMELE